MPVAFCYRDAGLIVCKFPCELNQQDKRFTVKSVEGDSHFNRYDNDFTWPIDANVDLATYNTVEPRYPLLVSWTFWSRLLQVALCPSR